MSNKGFDRRMAALVTEVERRKKQPGLHDYSYGRLIADTTEEQRDELERQYRVKKQKAGTGTLFPDGAADGFRKAREAEAEGRETEEE